MGFLTLGPGFLDVDQEYARGALFGRLSATIEDADLDSCSAIML